MVLHNLVHRHLEDLERLIVEHLNREDLYCPFLSIFAQLPYPMHPFLPPKHQQIHQHQQHLIIPRQLKIGDGKLLKRNAKSSPIPINFRGGKIESPQNHSSPCFELWAGPAYSNSPPPSSLPMPKFWMNPKRALSLELPPTASEITPYPIAKSAPASPTRELKHSAITFLHDDNTATKTLRRILNLDVADD